MAEVNKDELWGRYQKHQDAQNKLALQVAHKALDEPQDDMNIKADRTNITNGIGTLGALGIAAASGLLGLGGLGAGLMLARPSIAPLPPPMTTPKQYDAIYEEQQPDGSWKAIKREPLEMKHEPARQRS